MVHEENSTGRWWLPESPDRRIAGALTLDADDFALSTEGALQRSAALEAGEVPNELWQAAHHDVVLGSLSTGEDVTLVDCWGLATALPASEVREVWRPRAALLGVHLIDAKQEAFDRVEIQLEHLPAFARNLVGIGVNIEQCQDGTTTKAAFNSERRVLHRAAVGDATIQVVISPHAKFGHAEAHLKVEVSFDVAQGSPMTWEEAWAAWTLPLRDFLSLLSGRPCSVRQVVLQSADGHTATKRVRLLRRTHDLRRRPRKPLSTDDFIVHAGNLPGGFEQGLCNWLEVHTRRNVAIREIEEVLHAPFRYLEDEFLAYTRAIRPLLSEDTKVASADAAQGEQQQWLEEVRRALPQHLRDGVMAQLNPPGPNERHRLLALIAQLGPIGTWLTGGDPADFAARVIATRGHFVHPSDRPPAKLLEGRDLVQHTRALGWLVRARMVSELGMPIDELLTRLRGTDADRVADEMEDRRHRGADAEDGQ